MKEQIWHVLDGPGRWQIQNALLLPLRARPKTGWRKPDEQLGLLEFTCRCEDYKIWFYGRLKTIRPKNNARTVFDLTVSVESIKDVPTVPFEATIRDYSIEEHHAKDTMLPANLGLHEWLRFQLGDLVVAPHYQGGMLLYVAGCGPDCEYRTALTLHCGVSSTGSITACSQHFTMPPNEIRFAIKKDLKKSSYNEGIKIHQTDRGFAVKIEETAIWH